MTGEKPNQAPTTPSTEADGLTDDQRVRRENNDQQQGARVTPGPADKEREPEAGRT